MKNSVSEQSFYIDSDEEEKPFSDNRVPSNDSDYSNEQDDDDDPRQQIKPNPAWPQSYRQSIDLYSSVPSPSLNFLGQSHLSGSFLSSSSLTPEIFTSLSTPLIPSPEEAKLRERRTSLPLLLPPSRRSSLQRIAPDGEPHGAPIPRNSKFGQAVLNGINVLCGVGILSTPYAVKQGGWLGISVLFVFALLSYYTGILLRSCLDSKPGLETYPDIGQAAFGPTGRVAISACCVEYIILESDNLSSLFPNAQLNLGFLCLNAKHLFAVMTALAVLPTVWLKDLSILSYISAGGVIASILVVGCLFWAGLVDHVGFESKQTMINISTLPVAVGLYGYCYSGHAVFPNIYTSLEKPNQYPAVLLASFGICTALYAAVAVLGYLMFGDSAESQFTLNMPKDLVASKIAVWTTVVNPFTKYALTMSPVAMCLEELVPSRGAKFHAYSILIRTSLVLSTLVVGVTIPFFGFVMSLIGSLFTMLVTLILPCACYLSILKGKISLLQGSMCVLVITVGIISSVVGTYSSLSKIIQNLI